MPDEADRPVSVAMVTAVKLSGIDTTVAGVRALFADAHVHCAVIVDGGRLVCVVDRDDIPQSL